MGDDGVHNEAEDIDNLVQANAIYGGVHFHTYSSPITVDETPFVVSTFVYSPGATLMIDADPPTRKVMASGASWVSVTVEGTSGQAVILHGLRPVILARRPPRPAFLTGHSGAVMKPREFDVDLAASEPIVGARSASFPFTVSAGDPEEFVLCPTVSAFEVSWHLELDWTCLGRHGTTIIDHDCAPFQLYPFDSEAFDDVDREWESEVWTRWLATPEAKAERAASRRRVAPPLMLSRNLRIIVPPPSDEW